MLVLAVMDVPAAAMMAATMMARVSTVTTPVVDDVTRMMRATPGGCGTRPDGGGDGENPRND
jgi:hypothetical protein